MGRKRADGAGPGSYSGQLDIGADYSAEQTEWLRAITRWQQQHGRYPTMLEALALARQLGYRKAATDLPFEAARNVASSPPAGNQPGRGHVQLQS